MYKSLAHRKLVQICTNLSLTEAEAGTNMYKSLSHGKPVQIPLSQEACTYMYKFEISHQNPVQICTNLSLTGDSVWMPHLHSTFAKT